MKTLEYLKGDETTVYVRRTPLGRSRPYSFKPLGEVVESVANKILRDPRFRGQFREVYIPPPTFICETCGFEGKNRLSLMGHQRAHSPKISHNKKKKRN